MRPHRSRAPAWAVLVLLGSHGSASAEPARVPCAGDGPPVLADDRGYTLRPAIAPTATLTLLGLPWVGDASVARRGDVADGPGGALAVARGRLGVCGSSGGLSYRLVWEPWDTFERAHVDAASWGRIVDAGIAWHPTDYSAVYAGVGKVPFGRGREQPAGALPLPTVSYATAALSPDRRLGASGDLSLGVARLAAGFYEASRLASLDAPGGLLVAGRLVIEPFGPVGRRAWPLVESVAGWTPRTRAVLGLSGAYRLGARDSGWAAGADLGVAQGRWLASAEVLYGAGWQLERPTSAPGRTANRLGVTVEALCLALPPWLAIAVRAEFLDENLAAAGLGRFLAFAAGATLYLAGPLAQVQIAYTRRVPLADAAASAGADAVILALTIAR